MSCSNWFPLPIVARIAGMVVQLAMFALPKQWMGRDAAKSVWALFVDIIGLGGFQPEENLWSRWASFNLKQEEDLGT